MVRPGYPIPAQATGFGSIEGSLAFPHVGPNDALNGRVDGRAMPAVPLLEATFVPLCGAGLGRVSGRFGDLPGPVAPRGGGRCLARAQAPARNSLEGSRTARLAVRCNLTSRCRGRLLLRDGGREIGRSRLGIKPGQRKQVTVGLNRRGRKLVRGKRSVRVSAKLKVKDGPSGRRKLTLAR